MCARAMAIRKLRAEGTIFLLQKAETIFAYYAKNVIIMRTLSARFFSDLCGIFLVFISNDQSYHSKIEK